MLRAIRFIVLALICGVPVPLTAQPAPAALSKNPWNGDWVLSRIRNTKMAMDSAAKGYRFTFSADGSILWEIPTLHETVRGRTDGQPMIIQRANAEGMTLAVTAEGERVLRYVVAKDRKPVGEGRMTLVEEGRAWVDISQPFGRPDLAHVVIYERPRNAVRHE